MSRRLVYLVGEPGAGKSTLLAAALYGWAREPVARPIAHQLLHRDGLVAAAEIGVARPMFPGTDALPMDAITGAERLLLEPPAPLMIGEGARLGCRRFLAWALHLEYEVTLVHVVSPLAAENRAARGTEQNSTWVKGQATRAANLVARPPAGTIVRTVDTSTGIAAVAELREILALPQDQKAAS